MFVHLHTHTEYSLLDGVSRIPDLVRRARDLGMPALAITDHGNLYGAVEFYLACREAGIRPILGVEAYLAHGSRHDRTPQEKSPYHLLLLAKNNTGYRNLVQLVTKAHLEGFYYKPRVDRELLLQHREGLIALTGCLNAEVPRLIAEGREEAAWKALCWYKEVFGEDLYVELQRHDSVPDLARVNPVLVDMARRAGVPLVATNDLHYVRREDAPLQDIVICIHTGTTLQDEKRLRMEGDTWYLRTPEEMRDLFADLPEAVENTLRVAEQCQVELDLSTLHLPDFPVPEGEEPHAFLSRLCWEGLERRRPGAPEKYRERLRYELDVIEKTRFTNYFLVVWDIARFARSRGILFGVRGSAASSLVLYCLGVTDIDPLEYDLVFERFLNIERREMPDIDMDFQDDRREEVLDYVVNKYGRDRVAHIITFGTMGPKAAVRDVGRVMGLPYADVDRIARLIPPRARTLDEAMEQNPELRELVEADPTYRRLLDTARRVEGMVHHVSTHAAGVVISREPLTNLVPLQRPVRDEGSPLAMTQYSMEPIAKLGLLKMDFLGLANLTILQRTIDLVARHRGVRLDLHSIPLDDPKTFDLLASGETADIFQLESAGMRRYIRELRPSSLRELAAMIALYRPGPMEHIETYIRAKHGLQQVTYPHPDLRPYLEETYGVIVYQDQVLFIVRAFAGYSLGEADIVRKAMGKKVPEIMQQERERFIRGALARGYSREEAEAVFHLIEPFAGYAFNKAHSVSYALVAYWTAYFKANYPVEYMTAVLNTRIDKLEKVASAVAECQRMGIPVLPPDVNRSEAHFTLEDLPDGQKGIRYGLAAIKNVGEQAVLPILEARARGGPFRSLEDFCQRVNLKGLSRRTLESLIRAGAMDGLAGPYGRAGLLEGLERLMAYAQKETRRRATGQVTMFDLLAQQGDAPPPLDLPRREATPQERNAWERELLGLPLSSSPLAGLLAQVRGEALVARDDLDPDLQGQRVTLVGQVAAVRPGQTRDGRPFLTVALELLGGPVEVTVWSEALETTREVWQEGALVWVTGRVRVREDQVGVVCETARPFRVEEPRPMGQEDLPRQGPKANGTTPAPEPRTLLLRMAESDRPSEDEDRLREAVRRLLDHPGQDRVLLEIRSGSRRVRMEFPSLTTRYSEDLRRELEDLLGPGSVEVLEG